MAQATEDGIEERLVDEKRLPFRIIEVRRNNRGLSAVAFLHQLEEDVGLFGFEIEVPQFVNVQDVDPDERVEQAARGSIGERGIHLVKEILCPDEAATIAVLNRLQQEPGRESCFPHASVANEDEVLGLGDKLEVGERADLLRVDAGLPLERERFYRPRLGQARLFDPPREGGLLPMMVLRA